MTTQEFRFTEKQLNRLLRVWPRSSDQEKARKFLEHVELTLARKLQQPSPTPVKQMIAYAADLHRSIKSLLTLIEQMPADVKDMLDISWVQLRHGADYYDKLFLALEADKNNQRAMLLETAIHALRGDDWGYVSEVDKLPPDLHKHMPEMLNDLIALEHAASTFEKMTKDSKRWNPKTLESKLAASFGLLYFYCFDKIPSAANGSSFRKFSSEFSEVTGYHIGADLVRWACETVRIHKENSL